MSNDPKVTEIIPTITDQYTMEHTPWPPANPIVQWSCGNCGGLAFKVYAEKYVTYIVCTNCGHHAVAHDG